MCRLLLITATSADLVKVRVELQANFIVLPTPSLVDNRAVVVAPKAGVSMEKLASSMAAAVLSAKIQPMCIFYFASSSKRQLPPVLRAPCFGLSPDNILRAIKFLSLEDPAVIKLLTEQPDLKGVMQAFLEVTVKPPAIV